jgi:hypothetical protein
MSDAAIIIGLDLARRVFPVHGARDEGSGLCRKWLSRGQVSVFLARQANCGVATQACATAHGRARGRRARHAPADSSEPHHAPAETHRDEATCIVATWSCDPAALSDTSAVDVLSLYAQFRDHRDERGAMAADRL